MLADLTYLDTSGLPIFPQLDDAIDLSSEACFAGIQGFLHPCKAIHGSLEAREAITNFRESFESFPSRLIYINTSSTLRIVDSSLADFRGVYTALSYVWGGIQDYVLSKSNLHEMYKELKPDKIPNTIRDAIVLAWRLGFQYLWVDALYVLTILIFQSL